MRRVNEWCSRRSRRGNNWERGKWSCERSCEWERVRKKTCVHMTSQTMRGRAGNKKRPMKQIEEAGYVERGGREEEERRRGAQCKWIAFSKCIGARSELSMQPSVKLLWWIKRNKIAATAGKTKDINYWANGLIELYSVRRRRCTKRRERSHKRCKSLTKKQARERETSERELNAEQMAPFHSPHWQWDKRLRDCWL